MLVDGEWTLPALRAAAGMCAVKFGLYDIPAGGGRAGQSRARPRARRRRRGRAPGRAAPGPRTRPSACREPAHFLLSPARAAPANMAVPHPAAAALPGSWGPSGRSTWPCTLSVPAVRSRSVDANCLFPAHAPK